MKNSFAETKLGKLFSQATDKGKIGLPVFSVTMDRGLVCRDELDRKMDTSLSPEGHLLVKKGDIAYNMMRMWQGASGVATEEGIVSPAYIVCRPNHKIDPIYAGYLFKSPLMIYKFWAYSYGITGDRLRLYFKDFRRIPVCIPPIEEQRKIAQILDAWDEAIEKTEKLIDAEQKLKKGLMQQLLTGKKRFKEFRNKPWKNLRISDIGKCIRGVSYKPEDLRDSENSSTVRLLRANNIQNGYVVLEDLQIVPVTRCSKDQVLRKSDILICMSSGSKTLVGKTASFEADVSYNYTVGAFCALFRAKSALYADYLKHFFYSDEYRKQLWVLYAGTNINNLKNTDIEQIRLKLPNEDGEIHAINTLLNTANKEIKCLIHKYEALRRLKEGLMHKLLTGKMRVEL